MSFLHNRWVVLVVVAVALLPPTVDTTVLHIAVPTLTRALGATGSEVLWMIDIYPLITAGFLVAMGTLGDRVGHKRLMMLGMTFFGIASGFAAFATSPEQLIAARAALALGSAMTMPGTLAIVRLTFLDDRERAVAIGVWTMIGSAGIAFGPVLGGALLQHFWWGSVFLVNVPIVLVILPLMWLTLPDRAEGTRRPWRVEQAIMMVTGTIALVYAVKSSIRPGATAWEAAGCAAMGLLLLGLFVRRQLHDAVPMLDLTLLRRPAIAIGIVTAFVAMMAIAGYELLFAQELQFVYGMSPLETGAYMLPLTIAVGFAGPVAGMLVARFGLRAVFTTGLFVTALAFYALAGLQIGEPSLLVVTVLATLGFSLACVLVASSTAVMASAPMDRAGAVGSMEATAYELGVGLGVTFFGVLIGLLYGHRFDLPDGMASGLAEPNSIGEALALAERIGGADGQALAESAKAAFSGAHQVVLIVAGTLILLLTVFVFRILRAPEPSVLHAAADREAA